MIRIVLLCLLLVGCQAPIKTYGPARTEVAQLTDIPSISKPTLPNIVKPKVEIAQVNGEQKVVLDKKGMIDLIGLYQSATISQNQVHVVVDTANQIIAERNALLVLAKQEEVRANDNQRKYDEEKNAHADDQFWNSIELNLTRIAALGLAITMGL